MKVSGVGICGWRRQLRKAIYFHRSDGWLVFMPSEGFRNLCVSNTLRIFSTGGGSECKRLKSRKEWYLQRASAVGPDDLLLTDCSNFS